MRDRLTTDKRKIFARESLTLMSMNKDELRQHYNEIFDRLQEYEVAEEQGQIIIPPCKVGDTVYVIEPCRCYNNYSEFDECHHRRTKATKWIEMVRVPTKHHTKCLKLFERPFKVEYMNKFGKTAFLTIEEAKAALKGGAE